MREQIIFCNPRKVYEGRPELDVATDYTEMAINDYDKLVSFDDKYTDFVETPDYEGSAGKKNRRNLLLTLFSKQPVIQIGNIRNKFTSSSYLFNPESSDKELLLPDLDIIQISGDSKTKEAAETIKKFYDRFGWETYIFNGKIKDKKEVNPTSDRFDHSIEIINPEALRELARKKVGYSLTDLCFD